MTECETDLLETSESEQLSESLCLEIREPIDNGGRVDRDLQVDADDHIVTEADTGPDISTQHMAMTLQSMAAAGLANYAPVRFRYLEAMAQRVSGNTVNPSRNLGKKLAAAIVQYQQEFIQAHRRASALLTAIHEQFPESADKAEDYFHRYDFNGLQKFYQALQRQPATTHSGLSDITRTLIQGLAEDDVGALEDSLLRQEQETVAAVLSQSGVKDGSKAALVELASVRRFRESCVKIHSKKVLKKALDDRPENPGPLNPQMLTIRSLSLLRDLSPEYLKRFVSYIDTMLWLEQSGAIPAPGKKSKAAKK